MSLEELIEEIDEIDLKILRLVKSRGRMTISDIARELSGIRARMTIFNRVHRLYFLGYLLLDRRIARGRVFCELTGKGELCVEDCGEDGEGDA